ncbi:MAG: aldehyde dehydrogenase [Zetaproteobacteria bacterium]|nr:aldehyde dehydrogenase [Pseudobdellovibrionaceae bacterium]
MSDSKVKSLKVYNPYDGGFIEELPYSTEKEVLTQLEKSHKLAIKKSPLAAYKRIEILENLVSLMASQKEKLALKAAAEGGKPLIDSKIEVDRAISSVKIAINILQSLSGEEVPMGLTPASANRFAFTQHHPCGVVVAISAFNHPLNLIVHQVIPAVAVGAPVLVKPADTTPLSCFYFLDLLYKAGLPKEWATPIMCEIPSAEKLVTDPRVSFLTFIGSAKVGWSLRSKLSPGTRCALEHGGAAPVILDESCDIQASVPLLCKGAFYHAGQVCVSVQRIYVHKRLSKIFLDQFLEKTNALIVGNPLDSKTEVGPLILPREVERVAAWVDESVQEGAKVLCGGKKLSDTSYAPTILLNPSVKSKVSCEEIFGPVVCVYEYTDAELAIEQANDVPFSFQAAVFSTDINKAFRFAHKLKAKTVMVNDHSAFRVDWMPFGGCEKSGMGVGGIPHSMKEMCEEKQLVVNIPELYK